jgi:2-dehydropantoate 2-reductase
LDFNLSLSLSLSLPLHQERDHKISSTIYYIIQYHTLSIPEDMRILILGAGAVGGYFGGRIVEQYNPQEEESSQEVQVTFLVRPGRRAEQLQRQGLQLQHPDGSYSSIPNVSFLVSTNDNQQQQQQSQTTTTTFDVIILACKAYGLHEALQTITPYVHDKVVILPLLNGMVHLDILQQYFPTTVTVWGGTCGIVATLDIDTGIIHRMTSDQFIRIGHLPKTDTTTKTTTTTVHVTSFVQVLQKAGIDAVVSDNIVQTMWDKWTFLATLGAATSLLNATLGEIVSTTTYGQEFVLNLYQECNTVATAEGSLPQDWEGRQAFYRRILSDKSSIIKASLCRDMEQGRQTEADHLVGDFIQRAKRHGIPTPLLSTAYTKLQIHEAQRQLRQPQN